MTKPNRNWLILIIAATAYAWLIGLGTTRAGAQLFPIFGQQQPPCTGPSCPTPGGFDPYAQGFGGGQLQMPIQSQQPIAQAPPRQFQRTPQASYHRAIIHVGRTIMYPPGQSFGGTGTLVERDGSKALILTAAHVLDTSGECWVDWGDGNRRPAELLGMDSVLDIAALVVEDSPLEIPAIPLAEEDPPIGATVEVAGYGGKQFKHCLARVLGFMPRQGQTEPTQLVSDFLPVSGDSGGPILYKQKLCGVLWGGRCQNNGPAFETQGTRVGPIRRFLQRIGWRIRARHQQRKPKPPAVKQPPAAPEVDPSKLVPVEPPSLGGPPGHEGRVIEEPAIDDAEIARIKADLDAMQSERDKLKAALDLANKHALAEAAKQRAAEEAAAAAVKAEQDKPPEIEINMPAPPPGPIARKIEGVAAAKGQAWLTTLLVGLGIPAGPAGWGAGLAASAAIGAAGYWLRGKISNRRHARLGARLQRVRGDEPESVRQPDSQPTIVTTEQPPAAAEVHRFNRYVPYDSQATDKAWADAHAILIEKFPGYRTALRAAQNLKNQIMKGQPID